MIAILLLSGVLCSCGEGGGSTVAAPPQTRAAAPAVTTKAALAGAQVVTLNTGTAAATIHYTVDGSTPNATSPVYSAPFLVTGNLTLKAYAAVSGETDSKVITQVFASNIAPGTLVWSEEFSNSTGSNQRPDAAVWTYDTGASGWGNHELEDYCAWNSASSPCDPASPNAYVGTDGFLHVVARKTAAGGYTSARMKSEGLFSFQYGRIEAKIRVPEGQGLWPAFWTLGNTVKSAGWPACGEQDIAERVDAALTPDWNEGSVHGPGFTGDAGLGTKYYFPAGQTAAGWHTYGMIWKPGSVAYYIDDPAKPYATFTNPASLAGLKDAVWPFDSGESAFFILNLAVGGKWPGDPDGTATFPAEMLVDYVRIYAN